MKRQECGVLVPVLIALILMGFAGGYSPQEMQRENTERLICEKNGMLLYTGDFEAVNDCRFSRETLLKGGLLCVSAERPLPEDFPVQQVHNVRSMIGLYVPTAQHVALSEETIYALCDLCSINPLVHTWITDGARAPVEQYALQNEAFEIYRQLMPTEQALRMAQADVPNSGCSEHQLATAFDIAFNGSLDWSCADPLDRSEDGRWLRENAWKFGFIRRYPPEKAHITGVGNEALHFRYVGIPHAAIMHAMDWCMEEYLCFLQMQNALRLTLNGVDYGIFSAAMDAQGAAFALPAGEMLQLSADHLGHAVCVMRLDQSASKSCSES